MIVEHKHIKLIILIFVGLEFTSGPNNPRALGAQRSGPPRTELFKPAV